LLNIMVFCSPTNDGPDSQKKMTQKPQNSNIFF